jgi:YHS domain-containing protein
MKRNFFLLILLGAYPATSFAQDVTNARKQQFNTENGVAISGYDPVAYFKHNKAIRGKKEFSVVYQGLTYYFSSQEDAGEFRKTPAKYEPQFGGWCAYAMGKDGSKVEIDPETYKITDGKLFVFYNKYFTNTLKSWNKDEVLLKRNADANWKKFYHN